MLTVFCTDFQFSLHMRVVAFLSIFSAPCALHAAEEDDDVDGDASVLPPLVVIVVVAAAAAVIVAVIVVAVACNTSVVQAEQ